MAGFSKEEKKKFDRDQLIGLLLFYGIITAIIIALVLV
jgi:hypothetical protein